MTSNNNNTDNDTLVQYIIVRNDLLQKPYKWSIGSLITNATHAAVQVIHNTYNDSDTQKYLNQNGNTTVNDTHNNTTQQQHNDNQQQLSQMHSVTLSVPSQDELLHVHNKLQHNNIQHVIWYEQPDNIYSCIATKPYLRSIIKPLLSHLKLLK